MRSSPTIQDIDKMVGIVWVDHSNETKVIITSGPSVSFIRDASKM